MCKVNCVFHILLLYFISFVICSRKTQTLYYENLIEEYTKIAEEFKYPEDAKEYKPKNDSINGKFLTIFLLTYLW